MKKQSFTGFMAFMMLGLSFAAVSCDNSGNEGATTDTTENSTSNNAGKQSAEAVLSGVHADTTVTGTARFEQDDNGRVKLNLELTVPAKANQQVAVHIHQNGSCGDNAAAAGPHWNPTSENHGRWEHNGYHSGDIGNIALDGDGKGSVELETDRWSIGGDQQKDILNKSLIVHSGVDDYTSQPAGNAGSRIGCAVITKRN